MQIDPGTPFAYREFINYGHENPARTLQIINQAKKEILGSNYTGWSTSEKWAFGIFFGLDFINLWDFTPQP